MTPCVCEGYGRKSRMCSPTQRVLQLRDNELEVDALFSVSEDAPGRMKVRILKNNHYVPPNPTELARVLAHPDAEIVQLNLILSALETWSSWRAYAESILLNSPPVGDVS